MKQQAAEWIRGYPIETFFLVAIAVCFGTLFPAVLIIPRESILILYLRAIGAYSPVLAGMFVARVIQPGWQPVPLVRRLLVFLPVWFIAGIILFITILFGWTYNRTKGSTLAPAVFHASMNSMNPLMEVFPITTAGSILLVGLAMAAVVSDRMWRRLPEDHPAVYHDGATSASAASSV